MPLPPPLKILNTLLTTITTIPLSPQTTPAQNTLARIPLSHRHLIITLHVLFPSILLPALDLLDRNLVAHLTVHVEGEEEQPEIYHVHSAQTPSKRHRQRSSSSSSSGNGKAYIVRLGAWNCTCAGFAFSVYGMGDCQVDNRLDGVGGDERERQRGLFGGLSTVGEGVPICKHLLACLLAAGWDALGGYVVEGRVTREEMAGIVADI
ncbi:hypothetical protein OQA88_1995 [Cercophora sp. LCS_1]